MRALPRTRFVPFRFLPFSFVISLYFIVSYHNEERNCREYSNFQTRSNPLPFPRFASINASRPEVFFPFLSGGHFSFIFGANQEPTLDLVADTVFAEWSERRVLASRVGNTVSGNWSELRYCGGNCAVHWRAIRIRHRYIKVGQF